MRPPEKEINGMRLMAKTMTAGVLALSVFTAACGGGGPVRPGDGPASPAGGSVALQGAGATFPFPLYSKWIDAYNKKSPNVKIDYQSIGSGGGIKQITERTVDFGASDAPMKDEQLHAIQGNEIMHIPTVLGAVVVTYNLQGVQSGLKLDGQTVADVYLGNVKRWNDAKIASQNPGVTLPDTPILPVYRSDGSGTTSIFTDYLAKVSPDWKGKVGSGTSVSWPAGVGAKGNEGVTGQVKSTPGAMGYVELIYAEQNKLPYASVKNMAGEYVTPSLDAVTAAGAAAAKTIPDDLRVSITNAEGAGAYPISGFTYLLVYKNYDDQAKGKALSDFIMWALNDGETMAKDLTYAPLPAEVQQKALAKVKLMNHNGTAFHP
jgi:phosphate transport system substrate-binding protein